MNPVPWKGLPFKPPPIDERRGLWGWLERLLPIANVSLDIFAKMRMLAAAGHVEEEASGLVCQTLAKHEVTEEEATAKTWVVDGVAAQRGDYILLARPVEQ